MKCMNCRGAMETRRENYRYEASGLSNVVLRGVEVSRCPECGAEEVAIPRIEQLHNVIARALIQKPGPLAGVEAKYLRKYLGWSSADFANRMGVTRETVSRWETGATPMGPSADRLLRLIVVTEKPVSDYSTDFFTQIRRTSLAARPVRLGLTVDHSGWHAALVGAR